MTTSKFGTSAETERMGFESGQKAGAEKSDTIYIVHVLSTNVPSTPVCSFLVFITHSHRREMIRFIVCNVDCIGIRFLSYAVVVW